MEPIRRKFRPDLSASSVDQLLEKRQRKRNYMTKKKPYDKDGNGQSTEGEKKPQKVVRSQNTEIMFIPSEMQPKFKQLNKPLLQSEIEKPDHWIMPEKKPQVSRDDIFRLERENILKAVDRQASSRHAAKVLAAARGLKVRAPSSKLSARGYILSRVTTAVNGDDQNA